MSYGYLIRAEKYSGRHSRKAFKIIKAEDFLELKRDMNPQIRSIL